MNLDQLYFMRPLKDYSDYTTPIKNLYICGSGGHPGSFFSEIIIITNH